MRSSSTECTCLASASGGSRIARITPLLESRITAMNGRITRPKATKGPATSNPTSSARSIAITLGTCSPSTTCR